jgi:hypothetical protein
MFIMIASTEDQDSLIATGKVIASRGRLGVFLSEDWNAYPTIAECVARFLECESVEEVKEKIEAGKYKLVPELTIL